METDAGGATTREARTEFYWTRGYKVVVDTMRRWRHPATRTETEMTRDERRAVVDRVVAYARREQGVRLAVEGADW